MMLEYRGVELFDRSAGLDFELVSGWRDGIVTKGDDTDVPGRAGAVEETRREARRVLRLHGVVTATDPEDWNELIGTLEATFDPAAASANLVVTSPYMGLASGTRTISCRVESFVATTIEHNLVTEYDVTLHALGNPPDWTAAP